MATGAVAEDHPTPMDHPVLTGKTVSEEATVAAMAYRTVTEYQLVETVTTAVVLAMEELARMVEGMATAEETVSVVVNLPVLTEHHPMDSEVETEVQEQEDHRAATEHLVEEMDSAVEATELARMDSAAVHRVATDHRKVETGLVVGMEVELRRVSTDLRAETEMEETVETVAMEDDRREATVRLREMEQDHRVSMGHLAETVAAMEDITVLMVAMVDIRLVERMVTVDTRQEGQVEMEVAMVVIPLEALVVTAVAMVVIPLEVQVAMEEATVVIPLVDQVVMVAVMEVTVKMKVM